MTPVVTLEHVTRVAPLGVRFHDAATGAFVSWGLSAELYPDGQPDLRRRGVVNRSDVFVFRDLPGLREIEYGAGDEPFWAAHPPQCPFVLEVHDTESRFLPFTLGVLLPVRRLLRFPIDSPLSSPPAVRQSLPLFSSPSRPVPDAMGVVRAEIVDTATGGPAAWALVEAKGPGQPAAVGLADEAGRVMLPIPYPKPIVTLGSPGSPAMPITRQSWTIDLTVRYRPRSPIPAAPDLAGVLAQPAATAWRDAAGTTPLTQASLAFGRDLVLVSVNGGARTPPLLITAGGSPP